MIRTLSHWLIGLTIALGVLPAHARTSVWHVTDGSTEMFLAGTIHLLSEDQFPLPCEFDAAYRRAERVVFEADLREASTPEFAGRYAQRMLYPTGKPLTSRVTKKTRRALRRWLSRNGLPQQPYVYMKPGILMASLMTQELARIGVSPGGVDQYYLERARTDELPVEFLESADSQMEMIINMGIGREDAYIRHLLHSMTQMQQMFRAMVKSWRSGDIGALARASDLPRMQKEFPVIFDQILVARNNAWMNRLRQMLTTAEIEFVLVGALHMATDAGLLAQLRRDGFAVTPVQGCA